MPYRVGEKGSYGCSGYPVLKEDDNTVMGCHDSELAARNQITAINMSEAEQSKKRLRSGMEGNTPAASGPSALDGPSYEEKDTIESGGGVGIKDPQAWPGTAISEEERRRKKERTEIWSGSFSPTRKSNYNDNTGDWFNAKPIPETSGFRNETETRNDISREIGKDMEIKEGDFVMGETTEGLVHGIVEHIMTEGGVLGTPGSEYALASMPPENPAMSVRVYEQDMDDKWVPTAYSIGMMYQDATVYDIDDHQMGKADEFEEMQYEAKNSPCWDGYRQEGMKPGRDGGMVPNCVPVQKWLDAIEKSETYTPNDGMKSAARRALKWKEDGKAKGAGTAVGWGRATDIVAGRSMSLSVVRRMFSFFSRHEKSSKPAKGFRSGEEGYPSKGRVMWDAWGGDAGYSWSRAIVERNRDKMLFNDFGKDITKAQKLSDIFKAKDISVGDHVLFAVPKPPAATEYAHGRVERVERSGKVTIGNESVDASSDNPVAVVRVWAENNGSYTQTDRRVAKPFSSLRVSEAPLEKFEGADIEKVSAATEKRLKELVENYNKNKEGNKRLSLSNLKQVYNRGIGAYRTNPGSVRGSVSSAEQWAMGRVNAFMRGLRGNFPRSAFDLDLFPKGHPRYSGKKD